MNEWLKNNAWALVIGIMTLVSTYTLYGYRLDKLETQVNANSAAITAITQSTSESNVKTQVALARIQTDIEYIKAQLVKITQ